MGQSFNLSDYWTGELISFNASKKRKLTQGLSDNSGEVTGMAVIHDSRCSPGATATATLADSDNTITLTLTGTSTTFFGTYNGVWNGVNNKCDVATRGTLHLAHG